jgi:hypothetical protein
MEGTARVAASFVAHLYVADAVAAASSMKHTRTLFFCDVRDKIVRSMQGIQRHCDHNALDISTDQLRTLKRLLSVDQQIPNCSVSILPMTPSCEIVTQWFFGSKQNSRQRS